MPTTGSLTGANQVVNDQSVSGVKASVMPNPNLKWEKTAQLNVGIGCQAYLTAKRTMYFFVDYDYDVGFKAVAHTGQIGFVRNW